MTKFKNTILFLAMAAVGAVFAIYNAHKDAKKTTLTTITTTTGWTIRAQFINESGKLRTTIDRSVPANASALPLPPYPIRVFVKETNEQFELNQASSELLIANVPAGTTRLTVAFPQFTALETESLATLSVPVDAPKK